MTDGAPPTSGSIINQPLLAAAPPDVVEGGIESFYRGALAKRIVTALAERGGILSEEDLADYRPVWNEPISTDYRGYTIQCPPPPCSGFQYLQTFNLLEPYDLATSGHNTARTMHVMMEAMKLSVADRIAFTALPEIPTQALISKEYADERRALIDLNKAASSQGERYTGPAPAGSILPGPAR